MTPKPLIDEYDIYLPWAHEFADEIAEVLKPFYQRGYRVSEVSKVIYDQTFLVEIHNRQYPPPEHIEQRKQLQREYNERKAQDEVR